VVREGVPLMRHEFVWGRSSNGMITSNFNVQFIGVRDAGRGVREGGGLWPQVYMGPLVSDWFGLIRAGGIGD